MIGAGRQLVRLGSGAEEVHAGAQLLEVNDVAVLDAHAGPSVESRGARDALGVHAEADLSDATAMVLGEGMAQEGESEATFALRPAHPHDGYPTLAGERLQRVTPAISQRLS